MQGQAKCSCCSIKPDFLSLFFLKKVDIELPKTENFFQCQQWLKSYSLLHHLQEMNPSDPSRDIKCTRCEKKFLMQFELDIHMKQVHIAADNLFIPCNAGCDRAFPTQGDLKRHVARVHLNVRHWKCNFCPLKFQTLAVLDRHEEREHKVSCQQKWCCPKCPTTFYTCPSTVKRHFDKVHLQLKPYGCHLCSCSFTWQYELKKHLKVNHGKLTLFKCSECSESFDKLKKLQQHMDSVHQFISCK
jgi:KRAB domain-containing zinc finger protein